MPVTNYIWDVVSDNVLMEKDDGETIARYVQEPTLYGEVISQERGGQTRYYNYDGEGNTCELTDEDQNVTDTYEYSAFGERIATTGTTENPFGYNGALGYYTNGDTGDIYARARTYEPTIGRWMTPDPLGLTAGVNLYDFCKNNSIYYCDPSGLKCNYCGPEALPSLVLTLLKAKEKISNVSLAKKLTVGQIPWPWDIQFYSNPHTLPCPTMACSDNDGGFA